MRLGIIAGNRTFPILLARNIRQDHPDIIIVGVCFRGETAGEFGRLCHKTFWVEAGRLRDLSGVVRQAACDSWIMAGQVNPLRIFRKRSWDADFRKLAESAGDFRPHSIFSRLIACLEDQGARFADSTFYLRKYLAGDGLMNEVVLPGAVACDVDYAVKQACRYTELDVGQTLAVKSAAVVALEAIEGTDRTIKRAAALAGPGCVVVKFSKANQDLRFDVPVVGLTTLKLLKKTKAAALVLESRRVLMLDKPELLDLSRRWGIAVVGRAR